MNRALAAFALTTALVAIEPPAAQASCHDAPGPKVNWEGCDKTRANLSNSLLRNANLRGADLRRARLDHADLSRADLTGANLTGASLSGTDMRAAKLEGATWFDGRICGQGSLGACK